MWPAPLCLLLLRQFHYAGEHLVGVAAALLYKAYREAQKAGVTAVKDCPAMVLIDTNSNR